MKYLKTIHPMWWGLFVALLGICWATSSLLPLIIIGGIVVFVAKAIERIVGADFL